MIKSLSTLGFVVISLTTYSQNWMNDIQTQSRSSKNTQQSVNRGSRANTNKSEVKVNMELNNRSNNVGGLTQVNYFNIQQSINISNINTRNEATNRSQPVTTPQRGINNISQNVKQQRSNPVEQRAVINTQQVQNPVIINRGNVAPVQSRGIINTQAQNPVPQNINRQVNTGNQNNVDVPVFNENPSRQLINDDNSFSNNKTINREPKFEVNIVQKKEIMTIPKPAVDLELNLNLRKENIKVEEKTRTEKISIPKMEKSGKSHTKRKSGKHAYYSQSNKGYLGMKIKNWYKRNFQSKRKIRVSVACPSF